MSKIWTWLGGITVVGVLAAVSFFTFQNYLHLQTVDAITVQFDAVTDLDAETVEELIVVREEAEQAVDLAFNLLGIFEALSLAITVGGVVLTAFGLTRFTTARNELEEARKLVERELEEARNRFESAIEEREQDITDMRADLTAAAQNDRQRTSDALLANALIPLGERQYKTSDYQGALNTYKRALDLDPTNPVTNQRLGYVYVQLGQLDEARHHYETAIDREENFAPALAGLGFVNRRLGEQVAKGIKGDLSDDERMNLVLERDKLFNRSEQLLLQALKLSPKLVDDDGESYWGIIGGLYKRRGQIDQAIEAYRQVTEVTPQSSYGYNNMAQLYQKKDEREKALELYAIVERIASKEAEAEAGNFWGYSDLISASYAVGKVEQAKKALPIAISIAPVDSPYMLEGTRDTLRDLTNFLEPEKVPPIEEAIEILETEMAERKARVVT